MFVYHINPCLILCDKTILRRVLIDIDCGLQIYKRDYTVQGHATLFTCTTSLKSQQKTYYLHISYRIFGSRRSLDAINGERFAGLNFHISFPGFQEYHEGFSTNILYEGVV